MPKQPRGLGMFDPHKHFFGSQVKYERLFVEHIGSSKPDIADEKSMIPLQQVERIKVESLDTNSDPYLLLRKSAGL